MLFKLRRQFFCFKVIALSSNVNHFVPCLSFNSDVARNENEKSIAKNKHFKTKCHLVSSLKRLGTGKAGLKRKQSKDKSSYFDGHIFFVRCYCIIWYIDFSSSRVYRPHWFISQIWVESSVLCGKRY